MPEKEINKLDILHLEDNPRDAELIKAILEDAGIECRVELVNSKNGYVSALSEKNFDIILCDFTLPSFNGKEALSLAKERSPATPFIYASGTIGEEAAVQALLDGATDYVLKPGLKRLVPAVRRAVRESEEERKLRLAEKMREMALEDLRNLESRYRGLLESAPDAAVIVDGKGKIAFMNRQTELTFGYDEKGLIGKSIDVLIPERYRKSHNRDLTRFILKPHARPMGSGIELYARRKDGTEFPADIMLSPLVTDRETSVLAMIRDLTDSKRAENALRESEERFRTIFEASPAAIVEIDPNGTFLSCNPAAVKIFGYPGEELLTKTFTDLKHPDDPVIGQVILRELGSNAKDVFRTEKRFVRKDGKVMRAELTLSAVRDLKNKFTRAVMIVDDITERREAEDALRNSEEQYRGLVEGVRDAIFSLSPEGRIESLNSAFEIITGWKREKWIGKNMVELLHPDDRAKAVRAEEEIAVGGSAGMSEYRIARSSGGYIVGEFNTAPRFKNEKLVGYLGIARDVTAQKSLEEQLRQSQRLEGLGTLAGGIAHDFNNILAIINGYASFLRRIVMDDEKGTRCLDSIEAAAHRATSLVRQLLTFARKEETVIGYLDVNEEVNEMYKLIGETFPRQVMICIELHGGPTIIYGDHSEMHQLLLNLCVNARDAMMDRDDGNMAGGILKIMTGIEKGDGLKELFPAAAEEEYVTISVTDTGKGMDEQTRRRIFEPFFTTKPQGKGTGLGLSTSYGIVHSHGGVIDVESTPGTGTTFTVYLPARHAAKGSWEKISAPEAEIRGGSETILVVEDEPGLREYLEYLLTIEGYKVITAPDGERAISIFLNHRDISLVLSDIGLPKIGGIDLMETVRTLNPETRVILASGYLDESERRRMKEKGVDAFIQKPYKREDLLRRVRAALDGD